AALVGDDAASPAAAKHGVGGEIVAQLDEAVEAELGQLGAQFDHALEAVVLSEWSRSHPHLPLPTFCCRTEGCRRRARAELRAAAAERGTVHDGTAVCPSAQAERARSGRISARRM